MMTNIDLSNHKGKVIIVTSGNGGVGKTFLTGSFATGLAKLGKKVIILTTDINNHILAMLLKTEWGERLTVYTTYDNKKLIVNEKTQGLNYWLKNGKGLLVRVRKNLDCIPLENFPNINKTLEKLLYKLKYYYDYIIIDNSFDEKRSPIVFKYSEKIIIASSGGVFCIKGINRILKEVEISKISNIIFNKYLDWKIPRENYKKITEMLKGTPINLPDQIKELSIIRTLVDDSKSIWESNDQRIKKTQEIIMNILKRL